MEPPSEFPLQEPLPLGEQPGSPDCGAEPQPSTPEELLDAQQDQERPGVRPRDPDQHSEGMEKDQGLYNQDHGPLEDREELYDLDHHPLEDREELYDLDHRLLEDREELYDLDHRLLEDREELYDLDHHPLEDREELYDLDHRPLEDREELYDLDHHPLEDREELYDLDHRPLKDREELYDLDHRPAEDQDRLHRSNQGQHRPNLDPDPDEVQFQERLCDLDQGPQPDQRCQLEDLTHDQSRPPGPDEIPADGPDRRLASVRHHIPPGDVWSAVTRDPAREPCRVQRLDQDPERERLGGLNKDPDQNHQEQNRHCAAELRESQNLDPSPRADRISERQRDKRRESGGESLEEDDLGEAGGAVPALVITQAAEAQRPVVAQPGDPEIAERQRVLEIRPVATDPSPNPSPVGDPACTDLLALRSDSVSLTSETTISVRSEDDDTRSVAASSVMSLFPRMQMDPLEKDWLRSSALGNTAALRQLLRHDSSLASKKTALHWAAKRGCLEALDMMAHAGVDVNVRSGYTALHLASIHGHLHILQVLINTYNAKTNIRDYHGKMAAQYWSGSADVFNKPSSQSRTWSEGRGTHRYPLPSLLLSSSRSQGLLNLHYPTGPQSPHSPSGQL